jgi:Mycotoxin biosynthesis protein UstYa
MFHELQCLDNIRQALIDKENQNEIVHHCMNYLRQMTLCHSHTALESVGWDSPPKVVDLTRSLYQCRDWTALHDEAATNHVQCKSLIHRFVQMHQSDLEPKRGDAENPTVMDLRRISFCTLNGITSPVFYLLLSPLMMMNIGNGWCREVSRERTRLISIPPAINGACAILLVPLYASSCIEADETPCVHFLRVRTSYT